MREIWVHNTVARMLDNDENNLVSGRYLTVANMQEVAYSLLPTDTASGAVASFPDGADGAPIESLTLSIEPVQEGSGDPSPDNVRPISGWTAAGVTHAGKNLFDLNRVQGTPTPPILLESPRVMETDKWYKGLRADNYYYSNYVICTIENNVLTVTTLNNVTYGAGFPVSCKPNTTYIVSAETTGTINFSVGCYDKEWNFLSRLKSPTMYSSPLSITTPDNAAYITIIIGSSINGTGTATNIQVELGSTATEYEPYNGETITHEFRDAQGNTLTVYGGEDELIAGKLRVTMGEIDSYAGQTIGEPWISSMDAYTPGGTPTTGAQVVYTLAAPLEYDLSRKDIRTLLGDNTIYADCGNVEVTYKADIGLYIDKKLAGQNAALTSSMNNITVLDTVKATLSKRRAK